MESVEQKLLSNAKEILEKNWRDTHTVPSPKLYPHQWSWDSAFISIGYSRYNQERAQKELLSMFEGQWKNGMLPHIVFRSKDDYFPGPKYWETELAEAAPKIETSGITQPPVHAIAALQIYKNANDKNMAINFLTEIFPKILSFHRYLFTKRDPEKTGLITIFHPWESGLDNSIRWDEALARIKVKNLPRYERVDIHKVNPGQRPSNNSYDRYIFLVNLMKNYNYDDDSIYKHIPFKIKDIVFSSIAYVANQAMMEIADLIGEHKREVEDWLKQTKQNYIDFFCSKDDEQKLVYDYDLITKKRIKKRTVASLVSLYSGLLKEDQSKIIVDWMRHSHFCTQNCVHKHPVASSISFQEKEFNPLNYWRGPIWININWMLYYGLLRYQLNNEANNLYNAIIDLITEHGFYEYYNPLTSEGLGTDNFSWTAALLIDLIFDMENRRRSV